MKVGASKQFSEALPKSNLLNCLMMQNLFMTWHIRAAKPKIFPVSNG
jgi:hypothetical protein